MAKNLEENIENVLKIIDEYSKYNYLNKVDTTKVYSSSFKV